MNAIKDGIKSVLGIVKILLKTTYKILMVAAFAYLFFILGCYNTSPEDTLKVLEKQAQMLQAEVSYAMSDDANKRVQRIYSRIKHVTLDKNGLPDSVRITHMMHGENAFVDVSGQVYLTKELVNKSTDDELALVIGHEVAHFQLRHTDPTLSQDDREQRIQEYHSDMLGAMYAQQAGFNLCKARKIYARWFAEDGISLGYSHPSHLQRYYYLSYTCKGAR